MILRVEHAKAPQMPNIVEGILSSSRESYKTERQILIKIGGCDGK